MNKKIIALAVAASLAAPMAANAAPTFYGKMQVEIGSVDDGTTSLTVTDDNKIGRLGVKGSEDLGGGLKAIYNFEWQIETTQGQVNDGTRIGMVGLKGNFGTIELGALKAPYKYAGGVKYDPFVATFLEARSRGGMSGKLTNLNAGDKGAFGHHGFNTDAIAYRNKVGNLEINILTSLDETGGQKGADGDLSASLKFKGKGWEVFVATASNDNGANDNGGAGIANTGYTANKIGGQWKSGPHKISAQLESTSAETALGDADADVTFVGYQFKMGKNIFVAQMGKTEFDVGVDVDYMTIGVIHKFSKKTRVFFGHSTSETTGLDTSATSLGLRVDF